MASHTFYRLEYRYNAVLMRARFEENRNIKDEKKMSELLIAGEKELANNMHWQPRKCKFHFYDPNLCLRHIMTNITLLFIFIF